MEPVRLWAAVEFTAQSGSTDALLGHAAQAGLHLTRIVPLPGGFRARCAAWHYRPLAALARQGHVRLRVKKRLGLFFRMRPLLRRTGLWAGLALFIPLLLWSQQFVWAVDTSTLTRGQAARAFAVLRQADLAPGAAATEAKRTAGEYALLESFCHKIPVQPGESYMIPGGVPHALGAGCFVAEIQEPSDLTAVPFPQEYLLEYRRKANPFGIFEPEDEQLYESRMLNSFHYEGLPLDKLLDRLKSKEPVLRQEPGGREIEIFGDRDTSYFSCTMVTVSGAMARKNTGDVQIGIVVSGEGCIRCGENALPVKQGSEVFFPCQVRDAVFEGDFSVILCNPGITAEYK